LHGGMNKAEKIWDANRPSPISFIQQLDYYGKLGAQFPLARLRVVYSKAGMQPAACLLRGTHVIDHKLYWSAPANEVEASYLTAFLNSETARARGESRQSRGQWGARDFDKVMFNLPIPRFGAENPLHNAIAEAAREAETIAAAVPLPENMKFQHARGLVRAALTGAGVAQRIDALVARLLDGT
ncbi:MAG: N-6 DNA methylase, partial [Methylocella sp.]